MKEREHIAYLEFANALLKVIGILEMAESQNSHHMIRIFQPQTEINGPRVLVKFWSRRLGCKSRWLGNQVPFSLSSFTWKRRQLNTRSSRFFSRLQAVDEIPASLKWTEKRPLPMAV